MKSGHRNIGKQKENVSQRTGHLKNSYLLILSHHKHSQVYTKSKLCCLKQKAKRKDPVFPHCDWLNTSNADSFWWRVVINFFQSSLAVAHLSWITSAFSFVKTEHRSSPLDATKLSFCCPFSLSVKNS